MDWIYDAAARLFTSADGLSHVDHEAVDAELASNTDSSGRPFSELLGLTGEAIAFLTGELTDEMRAARDAADVAMTAAGVDEALDATPEQIEAQALGANAVAALAAEDAADAALTDGSEDGAEDDGPSAAVPTA